MVKIPIGPIRLRRHRPVNLSFGRIILTGLLYPYFSECLYKGAQLLTIAPGANTAVVHELDLGGTFQLGCEWMLFKVLDSEDGEAVADIIRGNPRLPKHLQPFSDTFRTTTGEDSEGSS